MESIQLMHGEPGATVTFGSGYSCQYRSPAGLRLAGAMTTPPEVGAGAPQPVASKKAWVALKSLVFSAAVGTKAVRVSPRWILFHSCDQKKNARSWTIGPPKV